MENKLVGLVMVYDTPKIKYAFEKLRNQLTLKNIQHLCIQSTSEFAEKSHSLSCAVVVGGDGSILAVAELAAKKQVPLIGVHRGKLGFLSDIDPENYQRLFEVLSGDLIKEQRALLEVSVNGLNDKFLALNEFSLNRQDNTHLISYEISVDNCLMCTQRSDGVLVHTPTGSTAYALSAGGPIIQPMVNAFGIVPLNPHRLNTRPIVIKNSQTISILIQDQQNVVLGCDGRKLNISNVTKITVRKSQYMLTLLHPSDYDYFKVLRTKLHWEH